MNPVLVSCWGRPKKYFDAFIKTAANVGLDPINADPNDWGGDDWRTIEWFRKSEAQAKFIRDHQHEFTHFAFVDSYDIICAAGWNEILPKFERLNSPIVFGTECNCWPDAALAEKYPPILHRSKYLNAGFWMATTEAALPFAEELSRIAARRDRCDQGIVTDMFLSGKHPIALDTTCSLLFCCNMDSPSFLDLSQRRPVTKDTGEQPCFFHGNGNSPLWDIIKCLEPA